MLELGWREWCSLKELGIERIKAKIDTGAKTSTLHAVHIQKVVKDGRELASFEVHPHQRSGCDPVQCEAPIIGEKEVTASNGWREKRIVIATLLTIGQFEKRVELTLADRRAMGFRLLIGRDAIKGAACVNPNASFAQSRSSP